MKEGDQVVKYLCCLLDSMEVVEVEGPEIDFPELWICVPLDFKQYEPIQKVIM